MKAMHNYLYTRNKDNRRIKKLFYFRNVFFDAAKEQKI